MATFNYLPKCSCFLLQQPCPACVRYDAGLKKLRAEAKRVREAAKQAEIAARCREAEELALQWRTPFEILPKAPFEILPK